MEAETVRNTAEVTCRWGRGLRIGVEPQGPYNRDVSFLRRTTRGFCPIHSSRGPCGAPIQLDRTHTDGGLLLT